jgi:hypothetical protein
MQVAVVNDGKAELHTVNIKRDLGTRVDVDQGIKARDQVVLKSASHAHRWQQSSSLARGSAHLAVETVWGAQKPKEASMLLHLPIGKAA